MNRENHGPGGGRSRPTPLHGNRVFAVCVGTFLVMASEGVVGPILPLYAEGLGATVGIVGLVVGSAGLARLIFNFPAGSMSDAIGRRPLLIVGPLLTAAAAVLAGFAGSVWELLSYRFVAGMGNGLFMTGSIILLGDLEDDRQRIRAIGLYRATVMVGITLGPIAGGLVAEAAGLQAPFFLVAGLAGTAGVWSYAAVQETAGSETHERGKTRLPLRDRLRLVVRNRNLLLVSLMTFNMFFILVGTRQSVLPLLVSHRVDVGVGTVGLVLGMVSLSNLLSIAPAAYLSGRIGRKPVIVGSGIISGLSLVLFAASGSLAAFIVAATVMGVGTGLASPSTATYATEVASPEARGSAMGLYQMLGDAGFVVGPVTLGWLAQASGFGWALAFNAGLALAASGLFLVLAVEPREIVLRRREPVYLTEGDLPALEDHEGRTS